MGVFYHAQVCMNGHMISDAIEIEQDLMSNYCSKCGSKTITKCPACNGEIRGFYYVEGLASFEETTVPSYCHICGNSYPWTLSAIEALSSLIQNDEKTTTEQKKSVIESIPDILHETPKTQEAASKFKRFLSASGKFTQEFALKLLVTIAGETAKGTLFP